MEKIFVTVGTHPQQFNGLLKKIDELVAQKKIRGKILAQTGYSDYTPKNYEWKKFLGIEEFDAEMKRADLVITHAGEGNIGLAKNLGKKMVVVPRRFELDEHTNNHQLELAKVVEEKKIGLVAWKAEELESTLKKIETFKPGKIPRGKIIELLDGFVEREFSK